MSFEYLSQGSFDAPEDGIEERDACVAADAAARESAMNDSESRVEAMLEQMGPGTPEEQETLDSLRSRLAALSEVREDLGTAARAADLASAFESMDGAKTGTSGQDTLETSVTGLLADYPLLAQMLVRRIQSAAEAHPAHAEPQSLHLIKETGAILEEIETADRKLFKGVVLRTGERALRAGLSAMTLGIGGFAYDTLKDACLSIRAHQELRSKRRALLMNSSAATSPA